MKDFHTISPSRNFAVRTKQQHPTVRFDRFLLKILISSLTKSEVFFSENLAQNLVTLLRFRRGKLNMSLKKRKKLTS